MTGVRARVRAELTEEILAVARRHLAEQGAAALSLRGVARDVGMVSSAIYRYFASRDELLTALIVEAFDAVGEAAEQADATRPRDDLAGRWLAVARAVRGWAIANPQQYALVYGSPVPGYAAPPDTVDPAARVSFVLLQLLVDGTASGVLEDERIETSRAVRADLARLRGLAPGVPDGVLARGMHAWTWLFGHISYELFGHLHGVIEDYDAFFDLQAARTGEWLLGSHL
ncbi:MAG: TetR family transcriptional regulator [Actinomycetia bacterium]|nr:TetR family transcriptional regulator [Actinomycetes bacterium]